LLQHFRGHRNVSKTRPSIPPSIRPRPRHGEWQGAMRGNACSMGRVRNADIAPSWAG
jgi:hypothetical protein